MMLGLLAVAAVCHAAWNLLVKSSGQTGPEFVWLYAVVAAPASVGLLGWSIAQGDLARAWWPGLVSTVLHTAYAIVLQKAYQGGEFSVVYPVSRGMTPVLVTLVATPWLGWPSPLVLAGVGLVLAGVVGMDRMWAQPGVARGSVLGLAVAACSCAYTLWDAFAVAELGVRVLPYLAVGNLAQVVLLSVVVAARGGGVRRVRRVLPYWRRALLIAVLVPASYGLVLVAMSMEPVSAVAVGRTLNVVVGTLLGVLLLQERLSWGRAIGLVAVAGGVLLVSV